ncbi:MAG: HAMP domain-containing histidine kinase [Thermoplasmatales archaeon]|nr:HAMP domain-containing histidine kinase [Thermoplasmatales archaeon]
MCCCEIDYKGKAYLLNAIDITKKKEMEIKLKETNEKMRKTLEKEKKFLEEISHYFFNPLCIAKGYLDLSIPLAEESLKRKLEITKEAIIRVENVVKHIVMEGRIYE